MSIIHLKRANPIPDVDRLDVRTTVQHILSEIGRDGEAAARKFVAELDRWDRDIVVPAERIAKAKEDVPSRAKADVMFAYDNIRRFAEAQKRTICDCSVEILPGLTAGQRQIPVSTAGCYVPGGRYSHIASAIMTITTAKVAGVKQIVACSPPQIGTGVPDLLLFTMDLCGADYILSIGGAQAIAAMAHGLFGVPAADIIVGPGNQYVAEAKRALFGHVGIDMVAGPTDSMIVADETANASLVAADLVGQAEHGYNSPVWLVTTNVRLAEAILEEVPELIDRLPEINARNARSAWRDFGEVILCNNRDEMAQVADSYAPEHLHVQAADLDWWLQRLRVYGSLFLGEETTVAFGDKVSGPNHVLPTSGAARYTGGLSVHKFMKTVTWQRATEAGSVRLAEVAARISRLEGMEGHARTADIRLSKYSA